MVGERANGLAERLYLSLRSYVYTYVAYICMYVEIGGGFHQRPFCCTSTAVVVELADAAPGRVMSVRRTTLCHHCSRVHDVVLYYCCREMCCKMNNNRPTPLRLTAVAVIESPQRTQKAHIVRCVCSPTIAEDIKTEFVRFIPSSRIRHKIVPVSSPPPATHLRVNWQGGHQPQSHQRQQRKPRRSRRHSSMRRRRR